MSDTIPGVKWSLAMNCPLRQDDEKSKRVFDLARSYSGCLTESSGTFGICEGICVNGTTCSFIGNSFKTTVYYLPRDGFDVEGEFAGLGGVEGLHQLCGNCPANAALDGVAGCADFFQTPNGAHELDEELQRLAAGLGLEAAIKEVFPATDLMWYGFWIESPLSREALKLLQPLLEALLAESSAGSFSLRDADGLNQFVRAIERALYFSLELHVEMMPPGHVDFGWRTTFSHCPRCKAGAPVAPWTEVASDWVSCGMCGHEFDPEATYSMESMEATAFRKPSDLRETMGDERYRPFANAYLIQQGAAPQDAAAMVEQHLAPPDPKMLERRRQVAEKARRKREFILTVLFQGIGEARSDSQDPHFNRAIPEDYWFSAPEMEILLARCREYGVEFVSMTHHSVHDDLNGLRVHYRDFPDMESAFKHLLAQGCNEWFSIRLLIPDAAI